MKFPNEKELEKIRQEYPVGAKIKLIHMDDEQAPPAGTIGEVMFVDDVGSVHVKWQNGSSLALIPEVDSFKVIKKGSNS